VSSKAVGEAQPNTAKFPPMKDAKDQFLVDNFKE
jgi:hypothetical protein